MAISLSTQYFVHCPPADKIKLSLLSIATVDALGAPVEFQKHRGSFPPVTVMRESHVFAQKKQVGVLPAGTWTDDTSMTLCLAHSLTTSSSSESGEPGSKGGFDEDHQLEVYRSWYRNGFLACTGSCFDIGNTIKAAIQIYESNKSTALEQIQKQLGNPKGRGNGSLMRVLPVGLAYWSLGEDKAAELANRSSRTTHPDDMCREACEIYTRMVTWMMSNASTNHPFSKLDLLQRLSQLTVRSKDLQDILCIPPPPLDCPSVEEYYMQNHPLLQLATKYPPAVNSATGLPAVPPADPVSSSGYVFDTFKAALYAFFSTNTFDIGALLVVNMGDDADTVGVVYAGIASVWYSSTASSDSLFWSHRMRDWVENVRKKELVEKISDQLVEYERKVRSKQAIDV